MVEINVLNECESGSAKSDVRPRWAEMENPPAHLTVVGMSYKTAPIQVREPVSLSKEDLARALPMVSAQAGQSVILSTCDRTEVYSIVSDPAVGFAAVRHFLAEFHGLEPHAISPYMYEFFDVDAARHLHLVASGLDSMVMGDPQILRQVRLAIIAASKIDSNPAPVPLSRLFHSALRAGRRVREETSIGQNVPSLGQAAVELARRLLGDLGGLRVLLLGEGKEGKVVAGELTAAGGGDLTVVNQTEARGEELARQLGARAAPFSEIGRIIHNMDVVICAATAPEFVVTCHMVAQAVEKRGRQPMYLFDMTVPRNIDPTAGALKGVYLFNIDDIGLIAWQKSQSSGKPAIQAGEIVEEELGEFLGEWITPPGAVQQDKIESAFRKMRGLPSGQHEQPDDTVSFIVKNQLNALIDSRSKGADKSRWLETEAIRPPTGNKRTPQPLVVDRFQHRSPVDYLALREAA